MRIAVIRLKGKRGITPKVKATFVSLNLNRLHTCTLLPDTDGFRGMVQACKDSVSFGPVDEQAIEMLLIRRGLARDGKKLSATMSPEAIAKLAKEISSSGKSLSEHAILPFFFLAPPRGGFDGGSKKSPAPFGPLGRNAKIGGLLAKMA
ncbi:MAG: uL30 family ribosomal protein [Candidatus Micrarchaeota archaeon]|nr:uL30 family ribosomal protein [Candidatus Micrarchaeota archaeon]